MKTFVAIVVSICLAIGVEASCFRSKRVEEPAAEVDFYGLSDYLVGKIPSNDTEANLSQLTEDLNNLSGPMRKAANLVLEFSKVSTGECSEELRALLVRAAGAGMKAEYPKRIAEVIRPQLTSAMDTCTEYILEAYSKRKEANKEEILALLNRHSCGGRPCNERSLARAITRAYEGEPKEANCGQWLVDNDDRREKVVDEAKFNDIFHKYLVKPCEEWESKLGDIIRPYSAIYEICIGTSDFYKFHQVSRAIKWARESQSFCDRVWDNDQQRRTYMAKKFCFQ